MPEPLYLRIERTLVLRAESLPPGSLLGSEPALAAEFGVARMTLRAALDRLEARGIIERIPGRGTFVRGAAQPRPAGELMSFHEEMRRRGSVPSSRVLVAAERAADAREVEALRLAEPRVVALTRVRLADGVPLAIERAVFPVRLRALLDGDLEQDSVHAALRALGATPMLGDSVLSARAAGDDAAELDVPADEPLLVEQRVIVDEQAVPVEATESAYVASRYRLRVSFHVTD